MARYRQKQKWGEVKRNVLCISLVSSLLHFHAFVRQTHVDHQC